jgi:phospholipid/cholesterol/gamma-HCH transport system permease protein
MAVELQPQPRAERPPKPKSSGRNTPVRDTVTEIGEITKMSGLVMRGLVHTPRFGSEALHHAAGLIRRTSLLVFTMNAFLGMSVVNAGYFFLRSIGASDFLGTVSGYAAPRVLCTTMFGYVFTASVCCAMAAELGAMKINQEIDAYDSTGIDPLHYVVGTRILAVIIFIPVGTAISLIGNLAGVYFGSVVILQGIAPNTLLLLHWGVETITDQLYALVVIAMIAISTSLIACFFGLRARGGPAAVGSAVARSVVYNLVIVHVIAATAAAAFYSNNLHLPIGG